MASSRRPGKEVAAPKEVVEEAPPVIEKPIAGRVFTLKILNLANLVVQLTKVHLFEDSS